MPPLRPFLRRVPWVVPLLLVCGCGTYRVGDALVGVGTDPVAPTDLGAETDVDHLDFLAPLLGEPWEGTVAGGELAIRVGAQVLVPGRLARLRTEAFVDGAFAPAIEGFVIFDPRERAASYRAWTMDGAFLDGVARGDGEGGVVLLYELRAPLGFVRLEQRYAFLGPGRAAWTTRRLDADPDAGEDAAWDGGELRRPVRSSAQR